LAFNESTLCDEADTPSVNSRLGYVLRLSGLVGPNRHPGKFLLNNRMLKSSQAVVNLIHQQDAIGLILSILKGPLSGGIFNGVSDTKVTKQEYYQVAANALQLPAPQFEDSIKSEILPSKVVSGEKAKQGLNYVFVYPDLLQWVKKAP